MYTILIWSRGYGNEIEWEEAITSNVSLRSAKNKATRWINRNIFRSDYDRIEKDQVGPHSKQATWTLR